MMPYPVMTTCLDEHSYWRCHVRLRGKQQTISANKRYSPLWLLKRAIGTIINHNNTNLLRINIFFSYQSYFSQFKLKSVVHKFCLNFTSPDMSKSCIRYFLSTTYSKLARANQIWNQVWGLGICGLPYDLKRQSLVSASLWRRICNKIVIGRHLVSWSDCIYKFFYW